MKSQFGACFNLRVGCRAWLAVAIVSMGIVGAINASAGVATAKARKVKSHYFRPIGNLHYEYGNVFLPLKNGKILCFDGRQGYGVLKKDIEERITQAEDGKSYGNGVGMVELFDPETGKTRVLTKLPFTFGFRTYSDSMERPTRVVELNDGRILIVGYLVDNRGLTLEDLHLSKEELLRRGREFGGRAAPIVEPDLFGLIYDWNKGAVEIVYSPPEIRPRCWTNMHVLEDGRVIIVGGSLTTWPGYNRIFSKDEVLLFDPQTKDIKVVGHLRYPRSGHEMLLLNNSELIIFGGWGPCSLPGSERMFVPEMPIGGWGPFSLPGSERLFVPAMPSRLQLNKCSLDVEILDLKTMSPRLAGRLLTERAMFNALRLPGDKVLIHGGTLEFDYEQAASELYDLKSNTSSYVGESDTTLQRYALGDSYPYLLRGEGRQSKSAVKGNVVLLDWVICSYIYDYRDLVSGKPLPPYCYIKDSRLVPRMGFELVTLSNGRVFVMGGGNVLVEEFVYPEDCSKTDKKIDR